MKRKIYLIILVIILGIVVLIPSKVMAASRANYTIKKYDIKMVVHSDNTFDVTEEILSLIHI